MSLQQRFAVALLDPELECPAQLRAWNGSDPAKRFAVYRNNVLSSLIDALAASFPVVQQLVGENFFRAMAAVHVRNSPPRSRLLAHYGAGFPAFIEGFAPAASLPYLADMARLELLRIEAYHAADAGPVASDALATALATPERVGALCFQLHPALGVLDSAFAVVSLWAAHQDERPLAGFDPLQAECALVQRRGLEVEVLGIRPGDARFIQSLQQGQPLGQAAERALARDAEFDPARCLSHLLGSGAIIQFAYDNQGQCP
ncbi:DNA-binding domain-containing protein [Pseudomonas benzenivorans]|uniref:DNA-binding domain-containing protein n=1 Tax=Pseudomonas benzenivorans TaxID=556533 RepID=A0ABZ0Q110_9PSED|nr:DNA-binding domain-containing protein [Pseudomonas benzenivorans]WPC06820.1 DNA-binding domain-containing protein [Pseudomonas benzenivorans]